MKRTPLALSAAAVLLALAGCSGSADDTASSTPASTPTASSSASASDTAATASPTASASPTAEAIAPGFPLEVVPAMDGSTVLTTSYEEEGDLVTVSLTGRTAATGEEVAAWYTKAFEERDFFPLAGEEKVGNTVSRDFVRDGGAETANVSIVPEDGGSVFTVGANVLPSTAEGARP